MGDKRPRYEIGKQHITIQKIAEMDKLHPVGNAKMTRDTVYIEIGVQILVSML